MAPEAIGGIGVLALLVLLMLGVPIGVSLGLTGLVGLMVLLSPEAAVIKSGVVAFEMITRYELGVLPLFLLMAHVAFSAGASRDFFGVAAKFLGHRRGGLALASVGACAGFGAISGSSLATAATVGLVAMPEMKRHNYSPALATGALAAGGTLGQMIPPSGALIVFGVIAEQSIGELFTAAIIPGITQALFYMVAIALLCRWRPALGPALPRAPWSERWASFGKIADITLLILIVIGGLALGWFTPPEAASIGAVGSIVIAAVRRKLSVSSMIQALRETLSTTGMIYLIIIGATVFATFVSVSGLAGQMTALVTAMDAGPLVAVLLMALVLLVLGTFLDGLALMLLTTPIFLPVINQLGLSPIWFGVFLIRTMEIGMVHPPVGMNVYVIHRIAKDVPLTTVFKGIVPFLLTDFAHLALLILVPGLALWLPAQLGM